MARPGLARPDRVCKPCPVWLSVGLAALLFLFITACAAAATPTPLSTDVPSLTPVPSASVPALSASILPTPDQSYKQVSGRAPFTVTFAASLTGGTLPYSLAWDFDGDGVVDSTLSNPPPFRFNAPRAYTATLTVRDASGAAVQAERRIVAFAAPRMPNWKYGVTAHLERRRPPYYPTLADVNRAADFIQQAGIQSVRMDFNWDQLNPTPDEWKFDDYDAVVRSLRSRQLDLLGIVDYVSWWASSAQSSQDWRVRLYSEPLANSDFAHYTYAVVSHFKSDVHVWQIWNEPNTEGFWKPKPNPAHYVALLQEAYLAAKYADPDAVVLFAGLSGNGVEGTDDAGLARNFIGEAYDAGARGYFDALAIHPYSLPNGGIAPLRAKINAARAVMDQHGDQEIPLWLTEIGVPTDVPWWQTAPVQSEQDVADWLHAVYTQLWDLTPTIFWYELQDRNLDGDPEAHFGLLHADLSPKVAYPILQSMAHAK